MDILNNPETRYCELVLDISDRVKYLRKAHDGFYSGGHSFEETYKYDIDSLNERRSELRRLLKNMTR